MGRWVGNWNDRFSLSARSPQLTGGQCDLADLDALRKTLDRSQPDVIVNPAAHTAVDKAESESELAFRLNAEAPATMAKWAKRHGADLVHYSTDYVFDGALNRPYVENDEAKPLSVYGRSKLAGEEAIQESGCPHLIAADQLGLRSAGP